MRDPSLSMFARDGDGWSHRQFFGESQQHRDDALRSEIFTGVRPNSPGRLPETSSEAGVYLFYRGGQM